MRYVVILPDGSVFTRGGQRVFTHALIRQNKGDERYFVSLASDINKAVRESRVLEDRRSFVLIMPFDILDNGERFIDTRGV